MIANQIAQWPNVVIALSFAGLMLLLLMVVRRLGRLLPQTGQDERALAALDTFKVLGPLAGVFLSFSLVQAIGQFRTADVNVSREAANIYQLDRALAGAASLTDTRPARLALRAYLRHVVSHEWPAMQEGVDSVETAQALAHLQQAIDAMMESLPSEVRFSNDIDKNLDDLQDDRATRLGIARGGLPAIMWSVLAALLMLLFACAAFLQGSASRHPLPFLYIVGLGLLSALLFIMDRPFQGELSVSPAALVKIQNQLDARLR
ncbi:bestrophin-like domain [Xanthobacter sediminis]